MVRVKTINWQRFEDGSWSGFAGGTLVAKLKTAGGAYTFYIVTPQDSLPTDIECMESCEKQLNQFIQSIATHED